MSMRPLARRVIAALLLVLVTACYSWRPTTVSPQRLISEELPFVRVTLTSGETIFFENPSVRNDSIVGTGSSVRVASRDVRLFEERRFSVGKTTGLVLPLVLVGVAAVVFIDFINSLEN